MADDSYWIQQAQSWQAKYNTLKDQFDRSIDAVKNFKTNFGVREKGDGSIVIDFDKMVRALGPEGCAELRQVIDDVHGGKPKKPHLKLGVDGKVTELNAPVPPEVAAIGARS